MENKDKKKSDRKPNPQALAELYDRMILYFAMRELEKRKRFHWVGNCAPVVKN
jgi:hypothetical protein